MVMAPIDIRTPFPPRCPGHPPIGPGPIHPGPFDPGAFDRFAFTQKDKNKDGKLSLDEWVRSEKGEITMSDIKKFERYDRDKDGSVSQDEFVQGRKWDRIVGDWFKQGFEGVKDGVRPLAQLLEGKKEASKPAAEN